MFEYRFHRSISGFVIVDTFTRWVKLYHTTDAIALSAAEYHFSRFGAPHQLRSDNGPHFREFLHLIGVSHTLIIAYSKQENAIVEKCQRNQSHLIFK